MPQSRRIGLDNPTLSGRVRTHGRSAHVARRPVQPHIRRSLDGFAIAKPVVMSEIADNVRTPAGYANNQLRLKNPRPVPKSKPAIPRQARSVVLARHVTKSVNKKNKRRSIDGSRVSILLVAMASFVFITGIAVSYLGWRTNREAAAQVSVLSSSVNTEENSDVPTEDDISTAAVQSYQVAPDMVRYIKIPRLEVFARVKRLGVKSNGVLGAPTNIFDAGWYDGSAKPGENGAVLLDGHVHGPTKPGVFYRLGNLKTGDTVDLERGDGEIFTYKVVTSESVDQDKVDMTKALTPIEPGKKGLNIITCTGRYDIKTNKYEQRLIVYLVQQ